MPTIRIQEAGREGDAFLANLVIDGGDTYAIRITNPFTVGEERNLEWYFEEHLEFPFMEKARAGEAGKSVYKYGMTLFDQLFKDRDAFATWTGLCADLPSVRIEVVGGPEFQALHWEALTDSKTKLPIATQAVIVRRNTTPPLTTTRLAESPTVNILLITARPSGAKDVSYRTISRPLVTSLDNARIRARIEIVRPGTFEAFLRHLDENKRKPEADRYHVVHFDLHGGLLTFEDLTTGIGSGHVYYQPGYGRDDIERYDGQRAYLSFAGAKDGQSDLVEAGQLAKHLMQYGVPMVVLNACQSGKQVGAQETSLAARLMAAGVQLVVAMGYSVTVTAAERSMTEFYRLLLDGQPVATAIVGARRELERLKARRAYFGQKVDLEDWMLPVVYQSKDIKLTPKRLFPEEEEAFFQAEAARYGGASPEFGFFGRDLDILNIENRLLRSANDNILLVRGMGGAGKTTLLKHLAAWWQRTGLIGEVFYFGYDEKAFTRPQILWSIAKRLLDKYRFTTFESSSAVVQQTMVADELRKTRNLLILDNLESITGERLAIPNTLNEADQKDLHNFVRALNGGKSLVLLGSRSDEKWLSSGTFGANIHELGGLDPEAASNLAERILQARGAGQYREDKDLPRLIKLLAGFPLALEVVLSNLPAKSPTAILEELQVGGLDLNTGDANDKTKSIVECIAYSHSNLSADAQSLLLCLAPFTGVFNAMFLDAYTAALKKQPVLAYLPFDRWPDVLSEAQSMGLITPDRPESPILRLQPVFPYFLRTRLNDPSQSERHAGIEAAFRAHYRNLGGALIEWMKSNDPNTRQTGLVLTGVEEENLRKAALDCASAGEDFFNPLRALSDRFDVTQDHESALTMALAIHDRLTAAEKDGHHANAAFLNLALDEVALRYQRLQHYAEATSTYLEKLKIQNEHKDDPYLSKDRGVTLHQLGIVSQEQRQWVEAESYYKQGLEIYVEFKDRYEQAGTLHQLGIVSQEQRQWVEAENYYKQALEIFVEFNNRHSQAGTLHQLGMVSQEQRQWFEAENYYKQALEIFVEFNNRHSQASTLHQLGMVSQEQHQWFEAENYYKQALEIFVEFNNRHSQASTLHQLGRVSQEQRQWFEAENYYKQALEIFVEFKDNHNLGIVFRSLARLWKESGSESVVIDTAGALGVEPNQVRALFEQAPGAGGPDAPSETEAEA